MRILNHNQVLQILEGRDTLVLDAVADAYKAHYRGETVVPWSVFLRVPDTDRGRGIGLPAYIGGKNPIFGMKWITSFPENLHKGFARASGMIFMNDPATGIPTATIAGGHISMCRTAASAAVAARALVRGVPSTISLIGCGPIGAKMIYYLRHVFGEQISLLKVYDLDKEKAAELGAEFPGLKFEVASSLEDACDADIVSFATTAVTPYVPANLEFKPGSMVLNISLRDLPAEVVLRGKNVVDDADHVCRENTSMHLAEQASGSRNFIIGSIGELLSDPDPKSRLDADTPCIFNPFGLGILDIALADMILREATVAGVGIEDGPFY